MRDIILIKSWYLKLYREANKTNVEVHSNYKKLLVDILTLTNGKENSKFESASQEACVNN